MKRILNIAHRGASAYELENSFAAFEKAIKMKADMIELDLHITKDKEIIIMHDSRLRLTTDGKGKIEDLTYDEIKRFHEKNNEKIPTLEKVIQKTKNKIGLYCELKSFGIEDSFVNTINKYNYFSNVIASSFLHSIVKTIKEKSKRIKTSILLADVPIDPIRIAKDADADYVHFCWEERSAHPYELLSDEYVRKIKEAGLGIITWHEEHVVPIRHILQLDIDGICSNKPDVVAQELERMQI